MAPGNGCGDCKEIRAVRDELSSVATEAGRAMGEMRKAASELMEIAKTTAVQAEQLRTGSQKFAEIQSGLKDVTKRVIDLEIWRAGHDGAKQAGKEAGRLAGQRAAVLVAGIIGAASVTTQVLIAVFGG